MTDITAILEQLNQAVDETKTTVERYQRITETEIPTSLKAAVAQKWELTVNGAEFGALSHYAEQQQTEDRRRVIRLDRASLILQRFEDDLLMKTASGTGVFATLFAKFIKIPAQFIHLGTEISFDVGQAFAVYLATNSFVAIFDDFEELVGTVWTLVKAVGALFAVLLLKVMLSGATIEKFVVATHELFTIRDAAAERVRKAALPQRSTAKRYRRRKISRL